MAGSKKSTLSFRTALNNLVIYKKNKTTTRGKCVATLLQAFPIKNKYMKKSIISMLLFMVAMIAAAKDIKTVVFTTTPQMHCENCENKIKGNRFFMIPPKTISIVSRKLWNVNDFKIYCRKAKFGLIPQFSASRCTPAFCIPTQER